MVKPVGVEDDGQLKDCLQRVEGDVGKLPEKMR